MAKNNTKFWILAVLLTIGLWIFKDIIGFLNKYVGFLSELYIFSLCVGTALYLANRFR